MNTAMRVTRGRVQTAVWTLRHPANGRTVTLVGTMHIGDGSYYRHLSGLLAELAATGAEIQVEGIADRDEEGLCELERRRRAEARRWTDPEHTGPAVAVLAVDSQRTLRLPEGARNVDLSHAQLLRRVGWNEYQRLFRPAPPSYVPLPGRALRGAIRFQLRHHRSLERLRSISRRRRRVDRVVIGERNRVAFAGAVASLQQHDVVLVWGCDHLPGLAALFGTAGYRRLDWRWLDACTI